MGGREASQGCEVSDGLWQGCSADRAESLGVERTPFRTKASLPAFRQLEYRKAALLHAIENAGKTGNEAVPTVTTLLLLIAAFIQQTMMYMNEATKQLQLNTGYLIQMVEVNVSLVLVARKSQNSLHHCLSLLR